MNRKGKFTPYLSTTNQCKVEGHKEYTYNIGMVFSTRTKLDKNMFIIDHQEVDNCIQSALLNGSCEEMHIVMMQRLRALFKRKRIPVIAIKAVIYPDVPVGAAHLSYVWTNVAKNVELLPLLN